MLALTQQQLTAIGNKVVSDLKYNILNVKTGNFVPKSEREKMAESLHFEFGDNSFKLYGGKWIFTYENGRGPTVNPGDGAVRRNVLQVLKEEGIVSSYLNKRTGEPFDQPTLAYFISKKIHEKGTALFRENRKSGILSSVINDALVDQISDALFFEFESVVTSTLLS